VGGDCQSDSKRDVMLELSQIAMQADAHDAVGRPGIVLDTDDFSQ